MHVGVQLQHARAREQAMRALARTVDTIYDAACAQLQHAHARLAHLRQAQNAQARSQAPCLNVCAMHACSNSLSICPPATLHVDSARMCSIT